MHNECLERLFAPLGHDPPLRSVLYKGGKLNKSNEVALQEDLVILSEEILCGTNGDHDLNKLKQLGSLFISNVQCSLNFGQAFSKHNTFMLVLGVKAFSTILTPFGILNTDCCLIKCSFWASLSSCQYIARIKPTYMQKTHFSTFVAEKCWRVTPQSA